MINSPTVQWQPGIDRSSLLITFAAIAGTSTTPAFAFTTIAKELPCSTLFLIDPHEAVYQFGIPGVGTHFWEIADAIKQLQIREGVQRTTLIGNSSGGFAALVVGALLGNCTVHVFNPPTLLTSPEHSHIKTMCRRIRGAHPKNKRTFNLAAFLREESTRNTESYVYYSRGDAIDRKRTPFLKGIPGVHVVPYNLPGHELARYLAKDGIISELIHTSFIGESKHIEAVVNRSRRKTNLRMAGNFTKWWMQKIRRRIESARGLNTLDENKSQSAVQSGADPGSILVR